jgi:hypothetical protein
MSKVLREYGYPKDNGTRLTDWHGKTIGRGRKIRCTKVYAHERGGHLSNERCSYQFKIRGLWYACRGRGDGIAASCRVMKKAPPRSGSPYWDKLDGARRRKRRRR